MSQYTRHRFDGWRGNVRRAPAATLPPGSSSRGLQQFGARPINVMLKAAATKRKGGKITLAKI
jgi:hypothetical protein